MKSHIRQAPQRQYRKGFTLLELLIVLAILGVIAGMVVPQLLGSQKKANIKATQTSIHGLEQALKLYAVDHAGEYPQGGSEVFEMLTNTEDQDGNQVTAQLEAVPQDAWGHEFQYEHPSSKTENGKPAIWSPGPDGKDDQGSNDDVNNWDA